MDISLHVQKPWFLISFLLLLSFVSRFYSIFRCNVVCWSEVRSHDVVSTLRTDSLRMLHEFSRSFLPLLSLHPSSSVTLSLSLSLSISISLCPLLFHSRTCNVSCRSPIFTSDARLLHDAALQVENTDRLCINRSRDTEPSRGERRRKTRARVTRAERNQEGDEVSRKREREREREEVKTW